MSENKALSSTAWAFGAECAAKLIVPITNMILARILAPDAFGIVSTISMVISFAEMITSSSFQKYLVQKEFKDENELNRFASVAFWANFALAMTAFAVIAIFNAPLAEFVGSPGYGSSIVVASIALPLTALSGIYDGIYKRKFNFKTLFLIRVAVCLVPLIVTIPLALFGFGHWALIIGTLSGHVLRNLIFLFYKCTWFPKLYFKFSELRDMLSFGLWSLLEAVIAWLITWIDVFMVTKVFDLHYTGLYKNSQSTVTSILSIVTASTQPVLFSLLSRLQDNEVEFKKTYIDYVKYVSVFMIPTGVGLFAYSDVATMILLGEDWMEASGFIGLWGLATALTCLFGELNREAYRAINKPRVSFFVMLSHLIFIVPVCWLSLPLGFDKFVVIRSLAFLELLIPNIICTRFVLRVSLRKYLGGMFIPVFGSAVMYGAAFLMTYFLGDALWIRILQIFVCIIVYAAVISIFKEYRDIEKKMLGKVLGKLKKR